MDALIPHDAGAVGFGGYRGVLTTVNTVLFLGVLGLGLRFRCQLEAKVCVSLTGNFSNSKLMLPRDFIPAVDNYRGGTVLHLVCKFEQRVRNILHVQHARQFNRNFHSFLR